MVITNELKIKINELYLKIGTYSGVAKQIGCAATTVKNHIIEGFGKTSTSIKMFEKKDWDGFTNASSEHFFKHLDNLAPLCELTDSERKEIVELWEEMDL